MARARVWWPSDYVGMDHVRRTIRVDGERQMVTPSGVVFDVDQVRVVSRPGRIVRVVVMGPSVDRCTGVMWTVPDVLMPNWLREMLS